MTEAEAMGAVRRTIDAGGKITLTLSREVGGLHDPASGELSTFDASGAHLLGATSLVITPQTGDMRGTVSEGASVLVDGHSVTYSVTADATVSSQAPATLALAIDPGLEFALVGGEDVTIEEASSVSYDGRKIGAQRMVSRGWPVAAGDAGFLIDHQNKRQPKTGDIMTAPVSGAILNIDVGHVPYSTIRVGRAA